MPIPAGGSSPSSPSTTVQSGAYASVANVAAIYGALTDDQQVAVAALLVMAGATLRSNIPDLDARLTAGTLDSALPNMVSVNMVLRVIRNATGVRSETVGPFSRTWDTTTMGGTLLVTAAELAMLVTKPDAAPAGTIMTRPGLAPRPYGVRPWPWGVEPDRTCVVPRW